MAKKMPKNTSIIIDNQASNPTKLDSTEQKSIQKAAVASDVKKVEPKKSNKTKKTSDKPNIFKRMWKGIKGIFSELKKVTWPKAKDVAKATSVVIAVVFLFFIVLFCIDYVLAGLLSLIVNGHWAFAFIN